MIQRTVTFGGLTVRTVDSVGHAAPDLLVAFAHGYGAPGTDLVPLAAELMALAPALARARFVFPEAPLVPAELGPWGGRAWWPIDIAALEEALASGRARVLADTEPPGLGPARKALHKALDQALAEAHLGWERLVLGGFSQGAMLAIDLALRAEERPAGIVAFSPTLLCEDVWRRHAERRATLPTFISHGRHDPLLPFSATADLVTLLQRAGLAVDFVPFQGPHTIDADALVQAARFLVSRLPSAT